MSTASKCEAELFPDFGDPKVSKDEKVQLSADLYYFLLALTVKKTIKNQNIITAHTTRNILAGP